VARKHRLQIAGLIYHVVARGVRKQMIFRDDGDCQVYLVMLRGVIAVFGWDVLAYCLMGNHVHLVVRTPYPNIALGVQRLHGLYANHFNYRYDHSGHVFEARYWGEPIKNDAQLAVTLAYVANNPVKAGLCARPEDWRRSSFAAGGDPFIDTVTFGADSDLERQLGQATGASASSVARRAPA
jgi:REP element-mobilizing transposase RayT